MQAKHFPPVAPRVLPGKGPLLAAGLFLLVALSCLCPPDSAADVQKETLPNGMAYLILQNPGTASVSVDLWVRAGSRCESPGENGISHFVEHLLFKGTARRSALEISRQVASAGGSMNAYTQWEFTQVHLSMLPDHLPLALDLLADVAQNSVMTEEMVDRERKVILEEISLGKIYPPSYVLNLVTRTLFGENPLQLPISGTEETVKGIRRKDLSAFYGRHYTPGNCLLTVVGNVELSKAQEVIRDKFGSWPGGAERAGPPSTPLRQTQFREVRERKFLDQAIVILALQAVGLRDADRPAFEVINAVLGSGGSSRLYQEIREKRGLSYLVGSLYYPLSDTGIWGVYVGTKTKNIDEVKSIISREIGKMQQEPLSSPELEQTKKYLRGRTLIRNENNAALAEFISQGLLTDRWETPAEFLARVEAVTAEDLSRVARRYLGTDQRNSIVLRPYPGLSLFRNLF